MVNGPSLFCSRIRDFFSPRSAGNSPAAQLSPGRTPLIDDDDIDDDNEGVYSLSGFNPLRNLSSENLVYDDRLGNTNEVSHGIGGRLYHAVRRNSLLTGAMDEETTSASTSPAVQNDDSQSLEPDGRELGSFNAGFLGLEDPFSSGLGTRVAFGGLGRYGDVGVQDNNHPEQVLPYSGAFAAAIESLLPWTTGIPSMTAQGIADFIQRHTEPITGDDAHNSPNTECPICLEPPTDTHGCVQITKIPGCTHLIGRECLEEMLTHSAQSKKLCPLCRTEWVAADGIWQVYGELPRMSMGLDDSPGGFHGLGGIDSSPLGRFAGRAMVGLRLTHDDLRRSDRRPAGPPPVYHPEPSSPSARRGRCTRICRSRMA